MIAIVTDSSVYMTKEEAGGLGVYIIPMPYYVDGHPYSEQYLEDADADFLKKLNSGKCTTSQPPAITYTGLFEELRQAGCKIICITISSRLSGTYSSATLAAREVDKDGENIKVIDSRLTAGGMKFLVEFAANMAKDAGVCKDIDAGKNTKSFNEIVSLIESEREKISMVFTVEDLEPLRRSGRIGFIRKSVGTILNIRPIFKFADGAVVSHDFSKGKSQQVSKMIAAIPKDAKKINVQCIGGNDFARMLIKAVKTEFPNAEIQTSAIGAILGIHMGVPSFGIAWI